MNTFNIKYGLTQQLYKSKLVKSKTRVKLSLD